MNRFSIGIYAIIPVFIFLFVRLVLGFNGLYGQDSHEYYRYALALSTDFSNAINSTDFYWPKGFPFLGMLISKMGVPLDLALQLISLSSFIGIIYFTHRIADLIFSGKKNPLFLWALCLSPFMLKASVVGMSDMLSLLFVMMLIWVCLLFEKQKSILRFIIILFLAITSIYTRYAAAPMVMVLLFFVFLKMIEQRAIGVKISIGIIGLSVLLILMVFNNRFYEIVESIFLDWNLFNLFSRNFTTVDGQINHLVPNILYILGNFFHAGFLMIGVFLIPFYSKIEFFNRSLLLALFVYLVFLGGFFTQNYRFLVLSFPLALLFLFPLLLELGEWLKSKKVFKLFMVVFIPAQLIVFGVTFSKVYAIHQFEKEVADAIKSTRNDNDIYAFVVDQSFLANGVKNRVHNFYNEVFTDFQKGDLVVFNPAQFEHQFKNTQVMDNWNRIVEECELKILVEFENHWKIYEIEKVNELK